MFKALVLNQQDNKTVAGIEQLDESTLPAGDVIVAVDYSSLNYKDGLAITGKGKIIRDFPMVPGIDYAGQVISSSDDRYQPGDSVILTGWGVGENHWGGMAEKASVPADYLVAMPAGLDSRKAMIIGTAGLTAMLCVMALEDAGITPGKGEILVTGASGGVGSVAITLLDQLGYSVVAASGRPENSDWLKAIGADRLIDRAELLEPPRPLEKQRWAGAVDTVGSHVLAKVLTQIDYQGAVAACGLAGGFDLPTTVMPFILRGVKLLGVDSVMCPVEKRMQAWNRIAELLPESYYSNGATEVALDALPELAEAITNGQVTGRTLIRL
ncbi:MDR family oxidoreductase [Endozoicomonas sp. ONNA2]|uniref:acrylyl-CoA reductase (NADPH) n=1 Tax=Endozoicomonas sp. ONNA2 TaxID=2828741 RepID=UPI002147B70D|nr:MDR family oxidoreductase [Endozoicomonas sp. ONNA2]